MLEPIGPYLTGLRARQQHFEGGQHLFHRGDPVTELHFLAEASLYSSTYHCDAVAFGAADTRVYAKASLKKLLVKSSEFSNVWASYLAQELQRSRLRSEILSLRTVSERLDAWIVWNGGSFPEKGEWKLVANQIGISPEALYREIAKRRVCTL